MSTARLLASVVMAVSSFAASTSCVILNPDGGAVTTIVPPPGGAAFKPVGLFFNHRCGSLDCHGEAGRNFRVYGKEGLRLSPTDFPGGSPTTAAELDATYQSAVTLEPEIMNDVVAECGQSPASCAPGAAAPLPQQQLTLYRKPLGIESHKGGTVIQMGDDQDTCLSSWSTGTVDTTACGNAANPADYP
jgi:hypothetical protein